MRPRTVCARTYMGIGVGRLRSELGARARRGAVSGLSLADARSVGGPARLVGREMEGTMLGTEDKDVATASASRTTTKDRFEGTAASSGTTSRSFIPACDHAHGAYKSTNTDAFTPIIHSARLPCVFSLATQVLAPDLAHRRRRRCAACQAPAARWRRLPALGSGYSLQLAGRRDARSVLATKPVHIQLCEIASTR